MSLQLSIPKDLDDTWRTVIEHQYNLALAPLHESLRNPRVSFTRIRDLSGDQFFFCEAIVRLPSGERLRLSGQHTDGRTAAADVFMRIRRMVGRRRWTLREEPTLSRSSAV